MRHTRSLILSLAFASVAGGCVGTIDSAPEPPSSGDPGDGTPTGGDPTGGSGGSNTPTPPTNESNVQAATDFQADMGQDICQAVLDCIEMDPDLGQIITAIFGDSATACASFVANKNDDQQNCDGVGDGSIDFDPVAAQQCLDDLKAALTCDGLATDFQLPDSCQMVFTPAN